MWDLGSFESWFLEFFSFSLFSVPRIMQPASVTKFFEFKIFEHLINTLLSRCYRESVGNYHIVSDIIDICFISHCDASTKRSDSICKTCAAIFWLLGGNRAWEIMDISTHQLAELAFKALGSTATLDEILSTWHGIGKLIRTQLVSSKGVRLAALGTFTLTNGKLTRNILTSLLRNILASVSGTLWLHCQENFCVKSYLLWLKCALPDLIFISLHFFFFFKLIVATIAIFCKYNIEVVLEFSCHRRHTVMQNSF